MLALFGDLATELLIRLDGDEGLFRAYENVEFLAPVFAGDYIEATAELVAIGNTSRQDPLRGAQGHRQRARRRGSPPAPPRCSPSRSSSRAPWGRASRPKEPAAQAARALHAGSAAGPAPGAEPIVTPPSRRTRSSSPRPSSGPSSRARRRLTCPSRPQEVADEAARCREAGAAVIHLHVRNDGRVEHPVERALRRGHRRHPQEVRLRHPAVDRRRGRHVDRRALRPARVQARDGDAQLRHDQLRRRRLRQLARPTSASSPRRSAPPAPFPSSSATRSGTSRRRWRSRPRAPSSSRCTSSSCSA